MLVPCALGLGLHQRLIRLGTGKKGLKMGVLIKSGGALETTHKIETIHF